MANLPTAANTSNSTSNANSQIIDSSNCAKVNLIEQIPITLENVERVS
jgi:hypothetical protein